MEPKFVEKDAFTIVGLRYVGKAQSNEIPVLWDDFMKRMGEIQHMTGKRESFGAMQMVEEGADGAFEYVVGVEVTSTDDIPEGMVAYSIPEQRYAVFVHEGTLMNLKETYTFIYNEWLPKSGYVQAGTPDFELYNYEFKGIMDPSSRMYIYVAVKKP